MKLADLGEFGLIQKIAAQFASALPSTVEGIGDDCAIIHQSEHRSLLVTTDLLVENVHFLRADIAPADLGHKALAVNVSDIAAMGGTPLYAFLSIALPAEIQTSWLEEFFSGFQALAAMHGILLLGGDTTRSLQGVVLNIALIGDCESAKIKRRSTARPGDIICVTDQLGDSGAGLDAILQRRERSSLEAQLIARHYQPQPHVRQGQWLAQFAPVHSMMDVSDGIHSDLRRICEQSKCGVQIQLDQLPLSDQLVAYCQKYQLHAHDFAAMGGEDYCLLFTVAADQLEELQREYQAYFQKPFYPIGMVTDAARFCYLDGQGHTVELGEQGFEHFKEGK